MTSGTPAPPPHDGHQRLAAWVARCLGVDGVELREVLGGAGNVGFEVHTDDPAPVAFLRTKMGGDPPGRLGYSLRREGVILQVAERLGFPVAPVLGSRDDPDALLLGYVSGVSRPGPDEIEVVAPKYLALIAAVHACDASGFPVEQHASMRDAVVADVSAWVLDATDRGVMDEPLLALAARVLQERIPAENGPPSLVHGDVGAGNFLTLDGEVSAILDWELAHLGDPHEDLAWLWMRGAHTSFGDPQRRIAEYAAATGRRIDPDRLGWHLVLVMWKSVTVLHGRLRSAVPGELAMVALVVRLTYDALLGAQLVRVLGGSSPLLQQSPVRRAGLEANLAEELLGVAQLAPDQRVVLEYLRDAAELADWQREQLASECRSRLGIEPAELLGFIRSCPSHRLLDAAEVVARAADRMALSSPKSVRRIERAQRIGLGTA